MAKQPTIELSNGVRIPILHEDRNVIAIDKPAGWMLAPISWQNTGRNLFAALTSSMNAGDHWAKSRNLKFLRFVHRLDADTSGVLLMVKAPGAMPAYTELFEDREVGKVYLAVVHGVPEINEWRCQLCIAPVTDRPGRMEINNTLGKDAETLFRVVATAKDRALVMCWPKTGRTHQIRLHLATVGHPVVGDELYGPVPKTDAEKTNGTLSLRAVRLAYRDPFLAREVTIDADRREFVKAQGFDVEAPGLDNLAPPEKALEHPKGRFVRPQREPRRTDEPPRSSARPAWQERRSEGEFDSGRGSGPRRPSRSAGAEDFGGPPRKFAPRRDDWRPPERRSPRPPRGDFGGDAPRYPRKPFRRDDDFQARGPEGRPAFKRSYDDRGPRDFDGPPRRPAGGYGRPFEDRGPRRPFEDRGPRRSFDERGPRRSFDDRPPRRSFDGPGRAERGEGERGPGVFRSSARPGLRAGFQKSSGYGPREGGRPPGKFGGKPGGKFAGGDKPFWARKPGGRPFKKFSGPR